MSLSYQYRALRVRQTPNGAWIILFAAPATEIYDWSGIPQKQGSSNKQETIGFQRVEDTKRISQIEKFYRDPKNLVQNPLLCAARQVSDSAVRFEEDEGTNPDDNYQTGTIFIELADLEKLNILELMRRVKIELERRVPSLKENTVPDERKKEIKLQLNLEIGENVYHSDESDDEIEYSDNQDSEMSDELSDESHILDFWEDIAARVSVLEEIGNGYSDEKKSFLGYSKDAMISFLKPVFVVDGQHRLRGAVEFARQQADSDECRDLVESKILDGDSDPDLLQKQLESDLSRKLPISLLLDDDPAEHVFQFVVVNQKATKVAPALLGTIVSTSLSRDEILRVQDRLENAGIEFTESRAITSLIRDKGSPFYGLVERGLSKPSGGKDLLQWKVFASIVRIFRDLKGGKLYHEKVDYADKWRRKYLQSSPLVMAWEDDVDSENPYQYWRKLDGPWRIVFIEFWDSVKCKLSNSEDESTRNYWGLPRESQIFNKISLTILSADFFQYLGDTKCTIDNRDHVRELVDSWLEDVNTNYFGQDWKLKHVRKASTGISKQWSKLWCEYRKDPQRLPKTSEYSKNYAG